jgi:hypothetical protein
MSQPTELQFTAPVGGPRFGKLPPLGISRPGPLSSSGELKRSVSVGLAVKKEWNESNWSWKVCELEPVPVDFPLERTHREIYDADATEVAKRISNALRLLSVDAEYDGEKARAKCTTSDMLSFRIRLYAGGQGGLPVVVEVQRRNGSSSSFMRVCRQILGAAEGAQVTAETVPPRKKMPPFMKGPVSAMQCLQSVAAKPDPDAETTIVLNKSMDLLRSKQKDSNLLGLENLCFLTDPLKTVPVVALGACKAIILRDNCSEIREEVGVMLQKDAFLPEEFDDDTMKVFADKSRHLALVLLSNVLSLTSIDGCLASAVKSEKWFADFLIPSLLDEVKSVESSANNAYEAACGLTSLATCSDVARRLMEDNAAIEDLQAAYHYGLHNHELLANEAERSLIALGKSV